MRLIQSGPVASLWEYHRQDRARLLIASTPPSRQLLLDPTASGSDYRRRLRAAVRAAMQLVAGESELDGSIAVLQVLRGGLSFAAEEAVASVLGQQPAVSFIGTERDGAAPVRLTYPRWELGDADVLVVADIIGTGGTLASVLIDAITRSRQPLRSIVLFTIGSAAGAERVSRLLTEVRPAPPRVLVVALEAYFGLPAADRAVSFPWLPFDLLRATAGAAPDFELARLARLDSLLERCVIYDGGLRAFAPAAHRQDRDGWWQRVIEHDSSPVELAEANAGLADYRAPYADWIAGHPWLDPASGQQLHQLGREALAYLEQASLIDYVEQVLLAPPSRPIRS